MFLGSSISGEITVSALSDKQSRSGLDAGGTNWQQEEKVPEENDVIVIGGGIAGCVAALRAAEGGRSVIILERSNDDRYMCNSRVTGGVFHVAMHDIHAPEGELVDRLLEASGEAADPCLSLMLARDARRVVEYLKRHGVRFMRASPAPHHSTALAPPALVRVGLQYEGRAGDVLLRLLEKRLKEMGGAIWRGLRARKLFGSPAVRCTGVIADGPAGPLTLFARDVVVADGGFQADPELLKLHIGPAPDKIVQRNARSGQGDGLRMVKAFGGATTRLDGFYGHLLSRDAISNDRLWPYPWLDEILVESILVSQNGKRFVDEGLGGIYVANRLAALDDPLSTQIVCDQHVWDGASRSRVLPPNPSLENQGATIHKADSLAELATRAGLSVTALQAEVDRYNAALAKQELSSLDPQRSDRSRLARPIISAPFRAIPVAPGITYTMGGIQIDTDARVLAEDGRIIDGLYAAGTCTGGLEGGDRVGYAGGLAKSAVTGLRAGEALAAAA